MRITPGLTAAALAAVLLTAGLASSSLRAQSSVNPSPRNANYEIRVTLDPQTRMLQGRERIRWRNITDTPADELWFHLYYNAWRNNRSTWLREASLRGRRRRGIPKPKKEDWGWSKVESMTLNTSAGRQSLSTRFESPDDQNPDDRTVLVADLPESVPPGESVEVEVVFSAKVPRTFARTGYRGQFFFIAQWFPKLGVFEPGGNWNCHQFHAGTEFYSDYGTYDVQMTVPEGWLLGATGVEQGVTQGSDGTATHRYVQNDVHDFAWTTSPDYREARDRFDVPGLKAVDMRLLYQPEHARQVARHFRAAKASLQYYGGWYGAYPYDHITIIDPAWRSGAGGMEYPTLFTAGTRYWNPDGGGSPEGVIVHEAGHQFWYGVVGNNEFENAWMDEGFNTFSTARTMEAAFGPSSYVRRFFRGFLPVMVPAIKRDRWTQGNRLDGYRRDARSDTEATPSYLYFPSSGGSITYNKTALWLSTLERTLGWETLQKILSTHFQRWKFRHPGPKDFFAIANEISGRDLTPFFDQVYRSSRVFDYAVTLVSSSRLKTKGWQEAEGGTLTYLEEDREGDSEAGDSEQMQAEGSSERLYETRVVVRRLQDGQLPVEILFRFADGQQVRKQWDGIREWKLYRFVRPAKLDYAAVDPEHKLLLDINYTNNSRLLKPAASLPAGKWASKWMFWLQDYMQTLAFLM